MSYWPYLGGSRMVMVQYIQTVAPMTQRLVHMLYTEKSCWTPGMVDWHSVKKTKSIKKMEKIVNTQLNLHFRSSKTLQ